MRPAIGLFALSILALTAHAQPKAPAPPAPTPPPAPPAPADPAAISARASLLAPIQIDGLTLTPVVASATATPAGAPAKAMLVLDEAMAQNLVKISEGARESVNDLSFVNASDQPVFVLAGEVIIGGKQDRIIGANTIIPPKTTLSVPVFCVEHGRWDNSSKTFTTAKALAHGRLRGKASFEAQGEVWKEVASKNEKRKTTNATDTYRTVAKQQSDGTLTAWQRKVDAAVAKVPPADRARMIGYVVALNGQVATVDMFQSPALFQKLEGKLVRSYLTEAVDVEAAKDVKPPTPTAVKAFMADADKAAEQRAYDNKAARTKIQKGARAGKSQVDFADDAPAAKPAPAVYESYQAH